MIVQVRIPRVHVRGTVAPVLAGARPIRPESRSRRRFHPSKTQPRTTRKSGDRADKRRSSQRCAARSKNATERWGTMGFIRTRVRHSAQTRRRLRGPGLAVRLSVSRTRSTAVRRRGSPAARRVAERGRPGAIRRPGVPAGLRQLEDHQRAARTADGGSPGSAPAAEGDLDDINSACPRALAPTRHASTPLARRPGPLSLARHPGRSIASQRSRDGRGSETFPRVGRATRGEGSSSQRFLPCHIARASARGAFAA